MADRATTMSIAALAVALAGFVWGNLHPDAAWWNRWVLDGLVGGLLVAALAANVARACREAGTASDPLNTSGTADDGHGFGAFEAEPRPARVVQAADLIRYTGPGFVEQDGEWRVADIDDTVDLAGGLAELRKLWGLVLLYAVRDGGDSVHYHPWRTDGGLTFIVGDKRYAFMAPAIGPAAGPVVAAARSLIDPLSKSAGQVAGDTPQEFVCGSFTLDVWGTPHEWVGVCWVAGGLAGVEFFRVAGPLTAAAPSETP